MKKEIIGSSKYGQKMYKCFRCDNPCFGYQCKICNKKGVSLSARRSIRNKKN